MRLDKFHSCDQMNLNKKMKEMLQIMPGDADHAGDAIHPVLQKGVGSGS